MINVTNLCCSVLPKNKAVKIIAAVCGGIVLLVAIYYILVALLVNGIS